MTPLILLVSSDHTQWHTFTDALKKALPVEIVRAQDGAQALKIAREQKLLAAIIDAPLADMSGVTLVKRLMEVNAMVHVALVSDKPADEFHTETEGLGIMLQLLPNPQAPQADVLAKHLRQMNGAL